MTPDPLRFTSGDPRLRRLNDRPVATRGDFVLYWMQMYRRAEDNAALDFAVATANEQGVPCLVYEALRPDYPLASDRLHTFVLEGACDVAERLAARGLMHVFFLPRTPDDARGVVARLAARARMVVTDDFPSFVVPGQSAELAERAPCAVVAVDDCAVVPMALLSEPESAARTIRPKVTAALDAWLRPLAAVEPRHAFARGPDLPFEAEALALPRVPRLVAACAIDRAVPPVPETRGGTVAAEARLRAFVRGALASYDADRNDPSRRSTSELSAYLHFGMISARRVALEAKAWGSGPALAALLEQLLVRRALSFNLARTRPDHASWTSLPAWARGALEEHQDDRRGVDLSVEELEAARSPDPLWNAAMTELRVRGAIQPYARMIWGKLPIAWMRSPRAAHAALVHLNDRWALDGRDPNGYANVSWCFGLHDRPWPGRPIYGTVRAMTSASARRKLEFEDYIARWARG